MNIKIVIENTSQLLCNIDFKNKNTNIVDNKKIITIIQKL